MGKKEEEKKDTMEIKEAPNWPSAKLEIGEMPVWRRVLHWGTGFAYFIIAYIGSVSSFFAVELLPINTPLGIVHFLVFLLWNAFTMTNLFRASFYGPGYLPKNWTPHDKKYEQKLQFCIPCQGYKAPRSHHCSKCKRCCAKMDHHCPWINNCVGHRNHGFFIRFLFFAIVGCIHAAFITSFAMYYAIFAGWFLRYGDGSEPIIYVTTSSFIALMMAFALAMGVTIALSVLFVTQLKYVWKNMNGIEQYIDGKAESLRKQRENDEHGQKIEPWVYPYHLGWKRNLREVFDGIFDARTRGNGIYWPVKANCDQFTFTEEQLLQKEMKRESSRIVTIKEDFEGKLFSAKKYGWRVCLRQPVIDGKCLKVKAGDVVVASRGISGWAYGFRENHPTDKGWIPIACTDLKLKKQLEEEEKREEEEAKKDQ